MKIYLNWQGQVRGTQRYRNFTITLIGELSSCDVQWKERGYKEVLRVGAMNCATEFFVARPGLGGTFRLSYDYLAQMPIGAGRDAIQARMEESRGTFHRYRGVPDLAEAIAVAKRIAAKHDRAERARREAV